MSISKYHPLVQKTKVELERLDKLKDVNWEMQRKYQSEFLPISVEPKLRKRALKFMDTLVKKLEANNHSIKFEYDRCNIDMYGVLREINLRQKYYRKRKDDGSGYVYNTFEKSDKLEFQIGHSYCKNWIDKKTKSLEDYFPAIYDYIEKDSKYWAERWKKHKIEEEQRKAQQKIEEEIAKQKAIEEEKKQKLFTDSENYFKAMNIRVYLNAIEAEINQLKKDEGKNLRDYIEWAHNKADEIDPLLLQIEELKLF